MEFAGKDIYNLI